MIEFNTSRGEHGDCYSIIKRNFTSFINQKYKFTIPDEGPLCFVFLVLPPKSLVMQCCKYLFPVLCLFSLSSYVVGVVSNVVRMMIVNK